MQRNGTSVRAPQFAAERQIILLRLNLESISSICAGELVDLTVPSQCFIEGVRLFACERELPEVSNVLHDVRSTYTLGTLVLPSHCRFNLSHVVHGIPLTPI